MYQPQAALSIKKSLEFVLALMSDGLPEMFNHEGEMLDYPAAKNLFAEVADQSPAEIIAHFNRAGEKWANGHPHFFLTS